MTKKEIKEKLRNLPGITAAEIVNAGGPAAEYIERLERDEVSIFEMTWGFRRAMRELDRKTKSD